MDAKNNDGNSHLSLLTNKADAENTAPSLLSTKGDDGYLLDSNKKQDIALNLLTAEDDDGNVALHLSCQNRNTDITKGILKVWQKRKMQVKLL